MDDLQTRKHNFLIAVRSANDGPASRSMLGVQFSIFELREPRTFQTATAIINATAGALTLDPRSPVREGDEIAPIKWTLGLGRHWLMMT